MNRNPCSRCLDFWIICTCKRVVSCLFVFQRISVHPCVLCVLHTFWHHSCSSIECTQRVSIKREKGTHISLRQAKPVGGVTEYYGTGYNCLQLGNVY